MVGLSKAKRLFFFTYILRMDRCNETPESAAHTWRIWMLPVSFAAWEQKEFFNPLLLQLFQSLPYKPFESKEIWGPFVPRLNLPGLIDERCRRFVRHEAISPHFSFLFTLDWLRGFKNGPAERDGAPLCWSHTKTPLSRHRGGDTERSWRKRRWKVESASPTCFWSRPV